MDPNQPQIPDLYEYAPDQEILGVPCPGCSQMPVKRVTFMYVMSFLIFTRHREYEAVLCRSCATKTGLSELAKSALLGWWGIPWGLLTLRAIWVNGRSLARWSTLGAPTALLTSVLALLPIAGLGYWLYSDQRDTSQARATGDYVSDAVARHVQSGNELYNQGNLAGALAEYRKAHDGAPNSSVVNFSLAQTLANTGAYAEALPFARRAEELDPEDEAHTALHGWLLATTGDLAAAKASAARLRGRPPGSEHAYGWLESLFFAVEDWEALRQLAAFGLESDPGQPYFSQMMIKALVKLDQLDEAQAFEHELTPEVRQDPEVGFALELLGMRLDPLQEARTLLEHWSLDHYSVEGMRLLATAAERSDDAAQVRTRVHAWLEQPDTPDDAWWLAEPWYSAREWPRALDAALERRVGMAAGALRFSTLNRVTDRDRLERLADDLRRLDHPLASRFEATYLALHLQPLSRQRRVEESRSFLARNPQSGPAKLALLDALVEDDPEEGRRMIDELRAADSQEEQDEELQMALRTVEAELLLVEGNPDAASELAASIDTTVLSSYTSPERVHLVLAESALQRGDHVQVRAQVDQLLAGDGYPPALLLRWASQYVRRQPVTYAQDVATWLERSGEDAHLSASITAQGILLAEGKVDRAWVERAVGADHPETLALVAFFKRLASSGERDEPGLERIAHSVHPHDFAPRIAQSMLGS